LGNCWQKIRILLVQNHAVHDRQRTAVKTLVPERHRSNDSFRITTAKPPAKIAIILVLTVRATKIVAANSDTYELIMTYLSGIMLECARHEPRRRMREGGSKHTLHPHCVRSRRRSMRARSFRVDSRVVDNNLAKVFLLSQPLIRVMDGRPDFRSVSGDRRNSQCGEEADVQQTKSVCGAAPQREKAHGTRTNYV
jgi:hypothetical protein